MGSRSQIAVVVGLVLLLLGGGAAYAWDAAKKDEIAEGVTIGGVDVGGQTAEEAELLIEGNLVEPLDRPVEVTYGNETFTLEERELDVRADTEAMVDAALSASQEGGLPGRLWRYATGGEVDEDISPTISYSEETLEDFIQGVQENVNRPPRDASISPSLSSLDPVPAQKGIEVLVDELRSDLEAAVQSPDSRTVEAEVESVKPEVTTDELAEQYPHYIVIDRGGFELRYFQDLKLVETYTVGVGQAGYETPAGTYSIANKAVNPAWTVPNADWTGDLAGQVIPGGAPNNPLEARWLGIYDGAGIHGTADIGSLGTASGCRCRR
jgi:hypothetical protein